MRILKRIQTSSFRVLVSTAILFISFLSLASVQIEADVIETYAGNGEGGYSGDGGPAVNAPIGVPYGLALDRARNLYLAKDGGEYYFPVVRKVDAAGIITTVAGTGVFGYSGDGGPATNALLKFPCAVAFDGRGNLYISDGQDQRIRKVDTSGVITTVVGNGVQGFSGDGGPATQASLAGPYGIAVDGVGNLYFADEGNLRVRKVDTAGIITTVAGNGTHGVCGDGGPATQACFADPTGVAVDDAGNLYIVDRFGHSIRKVDVAGVITTVAGGQPWYFCDNCLATESSLLEPRGVLVDGIGNLYIADTGNQRIRKVDTNGIITTVVGSGTYGYSGDGGPPTEASLNNPMAVALDDAGALYVGDATNLRVRRAYRMPYANFSGSPTRGYRDTNFTFTNTSRTDSETTYLWELGDGARSAEVNPAHAYSGRGVYRVTLTATAQSGLPEDSTTFQRDDYICAGYIFSADQATATTAPFTRFYTRGQTLHTRVWALLEDVDYTRLKSADVTVRDWRARSVKAVLTNEGNGIFSGSVLLSSIKLASGTGTATFTITDKSGKTFSATESITLE